jgi:hypothetical protein
MENTHAGRQAEWFVPRFGPAGFRAFVGLFFPPYTGMVLSFAAIGSVLAPSMKPGRLVAIVVIYALGLGLGAHSLDALGRKGEKPWGDAFTARELWLIAVASIAAAYGLAVYYMVRYVPRLWPIALAEGFFAFAYNLEWWRGRFHGDNWFAFSWGFLPCVAGFIMQANSISLEACVVASSMACLSLVQIKISRPYKALARRWERLGEDERSLADRFRALLKSLSLGVMLLAGGLLAWRLAS